MARRRIPWGGQSRRSQGVARRSLRFRTRSKFGKIRRSKRSFGRRPRRRRFKTRRSGGRARRASKRFVARNLPSRLQDPPKWHLYRRTLSLTPAGVSASNQQFWFDIPHGLSSDIDGLVALMVAAKGNVVQTAPPDWQPQLPNGLLRVVKSYMILFITNNSSTPVYAKMAVFRPRKNINEGPGTYPSSLADTDLIYNSRQTKEWQPSNFTYSSVTGLTDDVTSDGLGTIGYLWQNSVAFNRFYKGKIKSLKWAPMECKKFLFKHKGFSVDLSTEYTMQPGTTNPINWPVPFAEPPTYYVTPKDTGFSEMHRGRGMFVSFLAHGIPVSSDPNTAPTQMTLTNPMFDMFYTNAYKYAWSPLTQREYHSNANPISAVLDPWMAVPMPGATEAGPVVTGLQP